ncbi:MAG: PEGA domain-containing protein [Arenicellales bacterium]|nr:PEGA domain-containing protein [Arenicellales bacterium]
MKPVTVITEDGQTAQCTEADQLVIGGSDARIPLPGDSSNNEYAHLENRDGHIWLVPRTPTVAIELNQKKVDQAIPLRDGDRVTIGSATMVVNLENNTLRIRKAVSPGSLQPNRSTQPSEQRAHRPRRLRLFKLALLATFLSLVLVASFVFFATPISIAVKPEPEQLELNGFPPPVQLRDRYLVLPGKYQIRASKPGYELLNETVAIERGEFTTLNYTLEKLPGRISIRSQPENANVTLNGSSIGVTPLVQQRIPAGRHNLVLSAQRYQNAEMILDVEGMDREQVLNIELSPDWAPVSFRSEPADASVQVDGETLGTTPFTADLLSGVHLATFKLPRHQSETVEFTVVAGEALAIPMTVLIPTPGKLTVTSKPEDATVTVDNVYQGRTPLDLMLTPDVDHSITLAKAGHVVVTRSVNMEAAEERQMSIELPEEVGVIFITSDPADANLFVNGKAYGRATQRLRLTTREHTLEFRKPGYKTHRVTLTPRAGVSKELSITLSPVGTASAPALAPTVRTGDGQELKLIEPGQFTMGASRREQGRRANENLRRVELSRPYYLGVKEVTNAEFRRFKSAHSSGSAYGRSLDLDNQPVVNVSWGDAVAYLNWLSEKDGLPPAYRKNGDKWEQIRPVGKGYRLPTEAEWANAARFSAGKTRKYAWDGSYPPSTRVENFADKSAADLLPYSLSSYNDAFAVAAPVGSFPPSQIGLYDIGGNVAEWVNDYYAVYPSEVSTVVKDPIGPNTGRHYVIRGAGWKDSTISELRLSFRDYGDGPRNDVGFRIARYAK